MTPKLMRLDVCLPPIFGTKGRTVAPAPPTRISRIHLRAEIAAAAFAVVFLLGTVPTPRAQAQTLTVLYSFSGGTDGANPNARLLRDKAGNLYGTTADGGVATIGTVFKLDGSANESVLHSFSGGTDGATPLTGLVMDKAGNLYGATEGGGAHGYGIVFKVDTSGNETVLHSFTNVPDGAYPEGTGLVVNKAGNLFGTTTFGGSSGFGTVFKLDTTGNETVLHSFTNVPDGAAPFAGLVMDKKGNLYGTAEGGGAHGFGTVFKLIP